MDGSLPDGIPVDVDEREAAKAGSIPLWGGAGLTSFDPWLEGRTVSNNSLKAVN